MSDIEDGSAIGLARRTNTILTATQALIDPGTLSLITLGATTIAEDARTKILFSAQAVAATAKISQILYLPEVVSALQVMVKYEDANRSVKIRIFNSIDGIVFETTATAEYSVVDEMQLVQFFDDQLSRFVKVEIEAFTQNCTISAKARVIA